VAYEKGSLLVLQCNDVRMAISYSFELDGVISGRLEKEIVQILHKIRLKRYL
jgi:hypothetical protein